MAHVQIPPIPDLAYRHFETGPSLQIAVADSFDVLGRRAAGNRLGRCGARNRESKRECNQTACVMQHLSSERIHLFPVSFGPSLRLDAALLDDPPPLLLLAFQVSGRLLRRARDYREPPLLVELHLAGPGEDLTDVRI